MKQINRKAVENILYRYPNNIIKNLNIYNNNNNNNNNILFSNNAEYFILKPKGKKVIYGLHI